MIPLLLPLLYSSYEDLKKEEFSIIPVYICLAIAVVANLLVYGLDPNHTVYFAGVTISATSNFFGGLMALGIFGIIFVSSKGKGMGEGDIYVATLIGLSIGLIGFIIGLYTAVFGGLIYGFAKGIRAKKIKGVRIPFVPMLTLGGFIGFIAVSFLLRN